MSKDHASRVYLSPPHMSARERELLLQAFDSNWIAPTGPELNAFESEFADYLEVPYAVGLASGTAALHLALKLLGVDPGDEVVTASFTFAATANAITYVGASPVFVDCDTETWNLDPSLLAEELKQAAARGKKPRAVIAVDIYGQCADYQRIEEICRVHDVPVIEDAAESLGGTYLGRQAGSFGKFGCFSFNGNKIVTTSGGGMLVTHNKEAADRARFLAAQATERTPHYEHPEVGFNYRLSNLLAAIGRGQLAWLDERVEARRDNFRFYYQQLAEVPGLSFMPEPAAYWSTRWLTCITVDPSRFGASVTDIRLAMDHENIETRPVWKPMHMQPAFRHCRMRGGDVSEFLFATGLCLPSGSSLSTHDRQRVVNVIKKLAPRTYKPSVCDVSRLD